MTRHLRTVRRAVVLAALLSALLAAPGPVTAQPAEIQVTRFDDPAPGGGCAAGTGCSLREAIIHANALGGAGSVVRLPAGTYQLTLGAAGDDDPASGDLDVFTDIQVVGPSGGAAVVDVVVADRAFDAHGVPLLLRDLTISGGGQVDQGGGVRAAGSILELHRVTIRGGLAEFGGAIHGRFGQQVMITDSVIEGNVVLNDGGGIYLTGEGGLPSASTLSITGGVIRDNGAGGAGGGVAATGLGSISLSGTELVGNRAAIGGGMHSDSPADAPAQLHIVDTAFVENVADRDQTSFGGGLFAARAVLEATRMVLDGNRATGYGGGMSLTGTDATVVDSHVVANDASVGGGGIWAGGLLFSPTTSPLGLQGSLIEGNRSGHGAALWTWPGVSLELTTSTVSGNMGREGVGGLALQAPATIRSSTIAANSSEQSFGNLYVQGTDATLIGALLAQPGGGAQADDVNCYTLDGGTVTGAGTVVDDPSCPLPTGNLIDVDVALDALADNGGPLATHALQPGSIAVDAAGTDCPATDARGGPRPVDGDLDGTALCDAGSFELAALTDLVLSLADGPDPVPAGEVLTWTLTLFVQGPADGVGVEAELTLPGGLTDVGTDADPSACTLQASQLRCRWDVLEVGSAVTIRAAGRPTVPGELAAEATATSRATDPTPEDAIATTTTTVAEGVSGVEVIGGGGVIPTAIEVSRQRFPDPSQAPPSGVVLSRDDLFADSLGGAVLTRDAPLLFTATAALDPRTAAEIDRLLGGVGTVTLLGGEPALSAAVAEQLTAAGYTVRRLAGPSRVETAIAIARAAAPAGPPAVALARASGPADNPTAAWADAVTGGAWSATSGAPVLLTQTDALHPAVASYLAETAPARRVLLGGEAALSSAVAQAVGPHERIQGTNRYATASAIATGLWAPPVAGYLLTAGDHADGWAYALTAAGLAADGHRPMLLVEAARLPAETRALTCATEGARLTVIGGDEVVSAPVRDALAAGC